MKHTKHSLLTSAISLLLCVSMLLGTTMAWFTSSVESGEHEIYIGILDVDLQVKTADRGFVSLKNNDTDKLFDDVKRWEPNATALEVLSVVDNGNLAFEYNLGLNSSVTDQEAAKQFEVWVHEGDWASAGMDYDDLTPANGWKKVGTLSDILAGTPVFSDKVDLDNDHVDTQEVVRTYTVALHMSKDASGKDLMGKKLIVNAKLTATQLTAETDSFGKDYDADARIPGLDFTGGSASAAVTPDAAGKVSSPVTLSGEQVSAQIPAGVQMASGADRLTLSVSRVAQSASNVTASENEVLVPVDVHVEGVDSSNTVPMTITITDLAQAGLNEGNLKLYHVEGGVTEEMTRVASAADFTAHNQYAYDAATGTLYLYMATFSEVAVVADTENKWNGGVEAFAGGSGKENDPYLIANADQLAYFGKVVGGMDGYTLNNFKDQFVKLLSDINLGDKESENNPDLIFYPIGYYYTDDNNADGTTGDYYSTVQSFEGTFDGAGHTISNFYQNTWEIKGDYDANYYKDAMGLFGYVVNGAVKNLTVDNFSSDGEFTPTGVIAAYAVNSTFENIAITNCNPRVYNTGNGGIVGIGGNSDDPDDYKLTFTNITIDNTNKISALWGSWDVACGGLVGMFRGAGHVHMTNCHVAAQIDVFNDVCGNYQYYWYRYSGMMVGTNQNMITDENGYTVPEIEKFHAKDCTVHFGDWNDYYYCELVANSLASYTHDHQFSRLEQIQNVSEIEDASGNWSRTGNFILMNGKTPTDTCYHIMKDAEGKLYEHKHDVADGTNPEINEVVNGQTVLKENNQRIYLPFNQLFTGYGWGVKHIPVYNGEDYAFEGITILDREVADSVVKFEKADTAADTYTSGATVTIGDLFTAATIEDSKLTIKPETVQVTVSPVVGTGSTAGGTYTANTSDWTKGTLTFSGIGAATITITDYYFCTATTITATVTEPDSVEKFDLVFENTDDYLYRVGNANTVSLGSLFKAKDGAEIGNVTVTVGAPSNAEVAVYSVRSSDLSASGTYTANASDWTKGTIQFSGTGPVRVTIKDDAYCIEETLYLEVINAKNITKAESATSNDVVLLNDISGTFTVSNGHTFYGNGFTVYLPTASVQNVGNGFTGYISIGASQDDGIANGGNLDNVRIEGPVYPEMYIYRDQAKITDKSDADYGDGYNMRYFKNSVIVYGGNCTISNCYISGSRTALCLRGGNNVVIENTTLSGGAYANMQICAGSNVTLRNLTTVQTDVTDSYGKGKPAHGLGIAVDSAVVDIYIEGELNQHNWLNETQWNSIVPPAYQSQFPKFFTNNTFKEYWHYLNGEASPYVNMAFIYACNWDTSKIHDNRAAKNYATANSTIAGVSGGVYSKVNTVGGNAITDADLKAPGYAAPGFNPVAPVLNFDNTANNDDDDANDANDTYCVYDEGSGTLKIGVSGDSKTIDLSGVSIVKSGTTLAHTAYLNGTQISGNSVTINAADGAKQTLTFKATSNDAGYGANGEPLEGSIEYTWTVTVEMAVLAYPAPVWNMGGTYKFDTSNCVYAYYATTSGYGEAVPLYEGIKVNYYNKSGKLIELDLSGTTTLPTGSNNSNANAFTYTLADGSTLTMKYSSGWKSGATTHQFTTYNKKVYIYPQSLDNDNYIRAKTTNQNFDVKIAYTFTDPNGQSTGPVTMNWYNAMANNGKVTTVQWKTFDSTNGKESCVTPDTLITLADGTQVAVEDLTGDEQLLVWNLETGRYEAAPIVFVDSDAETEYEIIHLFFADGTDVEVIYEHGFFDMDLGEYVYLDAGNAANFIGHRFVKQASVSHNTWGVTELTDVVIERKVTTAYSPVTFEHLCYYVDGMLSMPGGIDGLFNIFDVDTSIMAYDQLKMAQDIETYGLFTYEDFADLIPEIAYEAFNGDILKVAIGKGMLTWEDIEYLAARYIPLI